jgi:hypothetical protein
MLSLSLVWHIIWFSRVTASLVLFLVIIRRQLYKQFPLFAVHSAWIAVAGMAVVALDYAPFVSGYQYFAGVAISSGVEAALAFMIIYQMFMQRLEHYPVVRDLGTFAFRATTVVFLITAVALAWLVPGQAPNQLFAAYSIVQRTVRTLQCGQLVFLFLFYAYFHLSWRSRAFGIALGLGILASTSLAVNAIHSQIASGKTWTPSEYTLESANEFTYLLAVLVWLSYLLAPDQSTTLDSGLPDHDLETWNRELERLLKP